MHPLESGLGRDPFDPSRFCKWTVAGWFDLAAPRPEMVGTIEQTARRLSRLCRFTGDAPRFYSVAEHSIFCDEIARLEGVPIAYRRAILMHDAAEGIVGDMVRPLKRLCPDFVEVERRVHGAFCDRFDLPRGFDAGHWDVLALASEKREFFPDAPAWPGVPEPGPWLPPRLDIAAAEREFLGRCAALGIA